MSNKKKVLFLASSAPRFKGDGTAPFILNMAKDISDLGFQVDVLVPHTAGIKNKEKIQNVTIYRNKYAYPDRLQTLFYNGGVSANLRGSKAKYLLIPLFIASQFFYAFTLIRKNKYDLIHSHWLIPQGLNGHILSKIFNIPHITFAHGADIMGYKSSLFLKIKSCVLNGATKNITNSSYSKKIVQELTNTDIKIIPTGATPISDTLPEKEKNNEIIELIFVGRITKEKGLIYLLQAIEKIPPTLSFNLKIIGDGLEKEECENYVQSLKQKECIKFLGLLSQQEVFQHLKQADIFIGPSIQTKDWVEAQGNTFVEAMFCGAAVIASNSGGITDSVIHEKTGLLVKEKSSDDIAAAITRLTKDTQLREELRKAGFKHAHKNFSRKETAKRIVKIYEEAFS